MVGVSSGRGICKQSQSDRFKGPDQEKETRLMLNRNQGKRKGPDELAMTCRRKSNQRPSKDKTRGVTVRKSTVDTRARVVRGEMEDEMRMTVRDESHDPGAEVQKSRRKEKKKRDTTRGAMKKSRRGGADAANAKHDALALQPRSGMICSSTPCTEEDTHRIQRQTHIDYIVSLLAHPFLLRLLAAHPRGLSRQRLLQHVLGHLGEPVWVSSRASLDV